MSPEMMSVTENKNATHWNLENGYDNTGSVDPETYPFRVVIVFQIYIYIHIVRLCLEYPFNANVLMLQIFHFYWLSV